MTCITMTNDDWYLFDEGISLINGDDTSFYNREYHGNATRLMMVDD